MRLFFASLIFALVCLFSSFIFGTPVSPHQSTHVCVAMQKKRHRYVICHAVVPIIEIWGSQSKQQHPNLPKNWQSFIIIVVVIINKRHRYHAVAATPEYNRRFVLCVSKFAPGLQTILLRIQQPRAVCWAAGWDDQAIPTTASRTCQVSVLCLIVRGIIFFQTSR